MREEASPFFCIALFLWMGLLFLFLLHAFFRGNPSSSSSGLDHVFTGTWVEDQSYPLYDPATCPFIEREFKCQGNGRPDLFYTHYRWHPLACNLLRFLPHIASFFNSPFLPETQSLQKSTQHHVYLPILVYANFKIFCHSFFF